LNKVDRINSTRDPEKHLIINHLDNIRGICTKDGLIYSLRRYYTASNEAKSFNYNVYDTTPTTFVVQGSCLDKEYSGFLHRFQEIASHVTLREKVPAKHCEENVWLIKPCFQNQGI